MRSRTFFVISLLAGVAFAGVVASGQGAGLKRIVKTADGATIRSGMARTVRPGDLLYVPPGVPHHFTDMKGFRAWLIRYDVEGWAGSGQ